MCHNCQIQVKNTVQYWWLQVKLIGADGCCTEHRAGRTTDLCGCGCGPSACRCWRTFVRSRGRSSPSLQCGSGREMIKHTYGYCYKNMVTLVLTSFLRYKIKSALMGWLMSDSRSCKYFYSDIWFMLIHWQTKSQLCIDSWPSWPNFHILP